MIFVESDMNNHGNSVIFQGKKLKCRNTENLAHNIVRFDNEFSVVINIFFYCRQKVIDD